MPPRQPPKVLILLVKTHKLTVLVSLPSTSTVNDVKAEALDALRSPAQCNSDPYAPMDDDSLEWKVPEVAGLDDFELSKAVKEKGRIVPTGRYEQLDRNAQLKNVLTNWENVFIQFKDPTGELLPVKVSLAPRDFEDEEEPPNKGKRKAE